MGREKLANLGEIVPEFIKELEKRDIHPEQIILYGSYARGEANEWSDVDLVVISKDFEKIDPLERLTILSHAAWPVQAAIEAIGYTPSEISERGPDSIFWEAIQEHHKVLYSTH
ncbi:MAG: nucleotidyltransferase domain-containing protein [Deltaproteobacteria bacterium]|nr:nucleotidyltransferase domain-containing protein [Deltaproteobacteria bacterium]